MKRYAISLGILLAVVIGTIGCATLRRNAATDAWKQLQHKTGWLVLGVLDDSVDQWLTPDQFELNGKRASKAERLPKKGDEIILIRADRLRILQYRIDGENQRFNSPAGHKLTGYDDTDVTLKPGTKVKIEEIVVAKQEPKLRIVWARVSPSS